MANHVDGYVLPVPKSNIEPYRRMAEKAGAIWKEHGRWCTANASARIWR